MRNNDKLIGFGDQLIYIWGNDGDDDESNDNPIDDLEEELKKKVRNDP